jgi:hypothetical protein
MCRAFSCIVDQAAKVTWKLGVDSHETLLAGTAYKDDTADPARMTFARVEITPDNDYLRPDEWTLKVDQTITPNWFAERHKTAARAAHTKWLAKLDKILVRKEMVHPFKIDPPAEITKKHIAMLRKWDSVWASVGASVRASVGDSVRDSVGDSVRDSVGDSVWDSVGASVWASVGASVWASVGASVWDSVGASVRASVGDSVRASVGASVRDSVRAYTGTFFNLSKWKYAKHPAGRYPFGPCVQLWLLGLVPSFDGKTWRLHGGPKATILFEITAEELRKSVR